MPEQIGPRFRGVLALEGVETSDGRMIEANETAWRDLPLTLMVMTKASHGGAPSTETDYAGRIDLIERRPLSDVPTSTVPTDLPPDTLAIYYEGNFDSSEVGVFVSVDEGDTWAEVSGGDTGDYHGAAIAGNDPNSLFVLGSNCAIGYSADFGATGIDSRKGNMATAGEIVRIIGG